MIIKTFELDPTPRRFGDLKPGDHFVTVIDLDIEKFLYLKISALANYGKNCVYLSNGFFTYQKSKNLQVYKVNVKSFKSNENEK